MGYPHSRPTVDEVVKECPYIYNILYDISNPILLQVEDDVSEILIPFCNFTSITPYIRYSPNRGLFKISMRYGTEVIHVKSFSLKEGIILAIQDSIKKFIDRKERDILEVFS